MLLKWKVLPPTTPSSAVRKPKWVNLAGETLVATDVYFGTAVLVGTKWEAIASAELPSAQLIQSVTPAWGGTWWR